MDIRISCLLVAIPLFYFVHYSSGVKLNDVKFKECDGGKKAKLLKISTDATFDNQVELLKGTNVTMYFQFKMLEQSKTAISKVFGKLGPLPEIPFSPPNPNACVNSNLTCPLQAGQTYTYRAVIPVKTEYPTIRLIVIWELTANGTPDPSTDLWCAQIPAQIKSK